MRRESVPVTNEPARRRGAHVVVLGNEKGGSGKSTIAMHLAVALMKAGYLVATIDLDCRQKSFTRYVENRRALAVRMGIELELSHHFTVDRATHNEIDRNETDEFASFAAAITTLEHTHDIVVIDTPGSDSYLMRLAHAMADTLITPLNDSFIDFDVLARVDSESGEIFAVSQYAELVCEARRQRRLADGGTTDWIVVRNRVGQFETRNGRNLERCLSLLASTLDFRPANGLSDRVIYRELFARGLTVLDTLDRSLFGIEPNLSHFTARTEVRSLLDVLNLPLDVRGRGRAEPRESWSGADPGLMAGE
ncbi:division plane positioning ATPase MipZ [Blastochloris sulfoviridis]|uniref:AAA family ATPase n=1 Tax=Blastochloris sulfoviridis TaxID=50712 RepID=A0A5M6I1F1_9HYPH|nr:division plane positioning ATPase MipZ [Blastochloris sulfoviridis]KAA5601996.1 AAA family ATPase [Blastochloris sulfoviridis]